MKNETAIKTQEPESLVEKKKTSYNDYIEKKSQTKERQWRNANNDAPNNNWVGRLLSEESNSDSDLHQNNVIVENESQQEDDLFSRKVSPKFWYWF